MRSGFLRLQAEEDVKIRCRPPAGRVKNYHGGVPTADMRLRNRDGSPVDPVPFLVLAAMAFAVAYSFGPIYFDALGVDLVPALALSTAAFLGLTALAFHRLVWAFDPLAREEVPPGVRFRRLLLAAVVAALALVALALPLVAG